MAGPIRLPPSDDPKVERLRGQWRASYHKHRDEKLFKASLVKMTDKARAQARERYQRKRQAALLNGPAPRPMGRPRATEQQRLENIIAKAEKADFWEVAAALREQLKNLSSNAEPNKSTEIET